MNATFSPTLQTIYNQWYETSTTCTTVQYCLLLAVLCQELLSLFHLLQGADDENWDWNGSEQETLVDNEDEGRTLMRNILTTASASLGEPALYEDLIARVSRSRSVSHFLVQVCRSKVAEKVTGLSLNSVLRYMQGSPHRDVARRRAGKLVEKVRTVHIDSVTSSTATSTADSSTGTEEFHSASSSPPSSTDGTSSESNE